MGYTQNKNYIDKKDLEHFWVAEAINTKQDKALSNEVAEALSGDGAEVHTLDDALLRLNEKAGTGGGGEPGQDGFSPTVEVSKTGKVTTVTITDKTGTHTATINDGEDGTNGTDGQPGAKGDKGEDGVSPTISAVRVSNGVQLTITDKNGSHSAVLNDGIGDGSTVATFADVPSDGKSYLRRNGTWVEGATKQELAEIGSKVGELSDLQTTDKTNVVNAINEALTKGGIPDAPSDGKQYVRQNGAWAENAPAVDAYSKSESDAKFAPTEQVGDLSKLDTDEKSNIVGAINEVLGGTQGFKTFKFAKGANNNADAMCVSSDYSTYSKGQIIYDGSHTKSVVYVEGLEKYVGGVITFTGIYTNYQYHGLCIYDAQDNVLSSKSLKDNVKYEIVVPQNASYAVVTSLKSLYPIQLTVSAKDDVVREAPSDGKCYVRKNETWTDAEETFATVDNVESISERVSSIQETLKEQEKKNEFQIYNDNVDIFKQINLRLNPSYIHTIPSIYDGATEDFLGKTQYVFNKGVTPSSQVKAYDTFFFRELSNLRFEGWVMLGKDKTTSSVATYTVEVGLLKQYPITTRLASYTAVSINTSTDYSQCKKNPISGTRTVAGFGDLVYKYDDYREDTTARYIHFSCSALFTDRYANLEIQFNGWGWLTAGTAFPQTVALIDPILTTTDEFEVEENEVDNYASILMQGGWNVQGKQGMVSDKEPIKRLLYLYGQTDRVWSKNDVNVNLTLTGDNVVGLDLFRVASAYYYKPFPNEKMFIQFGIDVSVLLSNSLNNYTTLIADYRMVLARGFKCGTSNEYATNQNKIVDVKNGIVYIRYVVPLPKDGVASQMSNTFIAKLSGSASQTSVTIYDLCVSSKPITLHGTHICNSDLIGKSMSLIGDSEYNVGEQILDTGYVLGMSTKDAHFGGYHWGYSKNDTTWFYKWDFRKDFCENPSDYYVLTASTNDDPNRDNWQLMTDESIKNVKDNYPCFGDDETTISEKLALFENMSADDKVRVFNYQSCMCAYIEQIFLSNPRAKIILANSPVTVTGKMTGSFSANNRGQWASGQNPNTARTANKPKFDKHDEIIHQIADRYNLPVLDFYHGVGMTYENITEFCVDGTHWYLDEQSYIDKSVDVLRNYHPIAMRQAEMIIDMIKNKIR